MNFAVKAVLVASLLAAALPAQACFAPPPELVKHHRDLVADSATIVLARALAPDSAETGHSLGDATPHFEAVEVLKGEIAPTFSLENGRYLVASEEQEFLLDDFVSDFSGHRDIAVWDRFRTRQWNESDCGMMPRFEPGETYLLFPDHPHWRAYELIRSEDDLWLTAVRNLLADSTRRAGLAVTVPQWLSLARGAFVVRAASCDSLDFDVVEVLVGNADGKWEPSPRSRTQYYGTGWTCEIGSRFLVVVYQDSRSGPEHTDSGLFNVDEGAVDFNRAIEGVVLDGTRWGGTELAVIGERTWSLADLQAELSRLQRP